MSESLAKLSPELQARIANIVAGNAVPQPSAPTQPSPVAAPQPQPQQVATPQQQQALVPKPPSLMDHLISLRQETAALRQEVEGLRQTVSANSDVVEAVGQAVGQIYQMFQLSSQPAAQGSTFSQGFQQQEAPQSDYGQSDF